MVDARCADGGTIGPMDPIDSFRRVVLGRQFASGVVAAAGLLLFAWIGAALGGAALALPLGSGALTVGFADQPGPPAAKLRELGFTCAASTLAFALVWASDAWPWSQLIVVPLLGFAGGMVALWGKRALPISFSVLFITVVTLGATPPASASTWGAGVALFGAGGAAYIGWALALGAALRARTRRVALAELLDALAAYREWQARSWLSDADDSTPRGMALLEATNDALQSARDLVLREARDASEVIDVRMLLELLDLFEAALAAQTDVGVLRAAFDGTPIPDHIAAGSRRSADALHALARALRQAGASARPADAAPWHAVAAAAQALRAAHDTAALRQACTALDSQLHTQRAIDTRVDRLGQLHDARASAADAAPIIGDVESFVSPLRYPPRQLLGHLRLRSPILRHALRLALAFAAALLLARAVFATQSHDYWILLTIAVILRPNFSVTRQRLKDRLIGTLLGCLAVALLLPLAPPLWLQLALLAVAMVLTRTFATTHYRYAALAASVMALLLVRLLDDGAQALIAQRLLDTAVGGALAWGCSYLLPNWESHDVPRLLDALLRAQRAYAAAVLAPQAGAEDAFRVPRKQLFDTLAALGGAHARMLEEPARRRAALPLLGELMQHGYLLGAHLATLRVLRAQRQRRLGAAQIEAMMAPVRDAVAQRLDPALAPPAPTPAAPAAADPLQRRLNLVVAAAARARRLADELRATAAA